MTTRKVSRAIEKGIIETMYSKMDKVKFVGRYPSKHLKRFGLFKKTYHFKFLKRYLPQRSILEYFVSFEKFKF